MTQDLKELWRFRELLWAMVERELRIRYKNSILGFFWSLVNPLITVMVMTFVFKYLMGNKTDSFSIYVLAAYLPYLFFQLALMDSAQSVLIALPIVRKVYFPREILPLAGVISNCIHFCLALLVLFMVMLVSSAGHGFYNSPFTLRLLFLPVLMVVTTALVTGLALIISALNVFYEDVKYVVGIGLYMLLFITPVMYFQETVFYATRKWGPNGDIVYFLYNLNPLAMLCTAFRRSIVPPTNIEVRVDNENVWRQPLPFDWLHFGLTVVASFSILYLGYALFNRLKWKFVERP